MKIRAELLAAVCFLLAGVPGLMARIISYAPVSDQYGVPAVQSRLARHYLLMESETAAPLWWGPCQITCPAPPSLVRRGQFVLYDSQGEESPRIVLGGGDPEPSLVAAAMWEGEDQLPRILVLTDARIRGDNAERATRLLYSANAGLSWRVTTFAAGSAVGESTYYEDVGGPFVRARGSQIRIGSADVPFVFSVINETARTSRIYGMLADGTPKLLVDTVGSTATRLLGADRDGKRFLVTSALVGGTVPVRVMDLAGSLTDATTVAANRLGFLEGWITPDDGVYLQDRGIPYERGWLTYSKNGQTIEVARELAPGTPSDVSFFAVPTFDFTGAWVLQRGPGLPTVLSRHQPGSPLLEQWRDITAPQVEALHAGASGQRLLIQVHRPRPMADAQNLFVDPALAIWEVGQAAPRAYHELFLIEGPGKGFVHLDVEEVTLGESFVFDSSSISSPPPPPVQISPGPGGGDVIQEWGVVRASLQQRLVLQGISRIAGAYGSFWRSDVTLRNPDSEKVSVQIRYVPSYAGMEGREMTIELGPHEIRVIRDALKALFGLENGGGAFFITPELNRALHVTSRTYTDSPRGTYGMGAGAIDIFAASGPRFPVTFAGAFQGSGTRTNLLVTDVSGHGTGVEMKIADHAGIQAQSTGGWIIPAGGQVQFNNVTSLLNVGAEQVGALLFRPTQREAIASVIVIDNRTNDPTYFPPDLPAPYVRTIPVIGHVDGANDSNFRSDLFLFNPADETKTVLLAAKLWNENTERVVSLTLLPHESKVIHDVLFTTFGKTGLARLRYRSGSQAESIGIRVSSRAYTIDSSGATYGLEIPSLNSFQNAGPGDTLEILGAFGDANFRANLALVELSSVFWGNVQVKVEIVDDEGAIIDSFQVTVPMGGGIQLNDLFRERALTGRTDGAVIRISPLGGLIGAFATVVDNGTNDPTYLGSVLAGR